MLFAKEKTQNYAILIIVMDTTFFTICLSVKLWVGRESESLHIDSPFQTKLQKKVPP